MFNISHLVEPESPASPHQSYHTPNLLKSTRSHTQLLQRLQPTCRFFNIPSEVAKLTYCNSFSTTTIKMPQTHTARTSPFPQPSNSTSLAHPTPRRSLALLTDVAQRLDTHTPSTDYKTRDAAGGEWHAPPPPPPSPVSW